MINLSKNITKNEFIRSNSLIKYNAIHNTNFKNEMNEQQLKNTILLCNLILQPVRDYYNAPLVVTSGFRGKLVDGLIRTDNLHQPVDKIELLSKESQHKQGCAGDFYIKSVDHKKVFDDIISGKIRIASIPIICFIDQIIFEQVKSTWIHASISSDFKPRKDILKFNGLNYSEYKI